MKLFWKSAQSTLHFKWVGGGLDQEVTSWGFGSLLLWCWIHHHSWRISLARCTIKIEGEDVFSHNLKLQFFHKLQRIIVATDCCSEVNLSKKTTSSVEKSLVGKGGRIAPISSNWWLFGKTKKIWMWVSAISSQNTHWSAQGIPLWISLEHVGRRSWETHQRKEWTFGGTYCFHIELQLWFVSFPSELANDMQWEYVNFTEQLPSTVSLQA